MHFVVLIPLSLVLTAAGVAALLWFGLFVFATLLTFVLRHPLAAGGFVALIVLLVLLVHEFRYPEPEEDDVTPAAASQPRYWPFPEMTLHGDVIPPSREILPRSYDRAPPHRDTVVRQVLVEPRDGRWPTSTS